MRSRPKMCLASAAEAKQNPTQTFAATHEGDTPYPKKRSPQLTRAARHPILEKKTPKKKNILPQTNMGDTINSNKSIIAATNPGETLTPEHALKPSKMTPHTPKTYCRNQLGRRPTIKNYFGNQLRRQPMAIASENMGDTMCSKTVIAETSCGNTPHPKNNRRSQLRLRRHHIYIHIHIYSALNNRYSHSLETYRAAAPTRDS